MVLQIGFRGGNKRRELFLILALHVLEGEYRSRLLVHDCTKASLRLHNYIRNTHFSAQCRKEDNKFDGIYVVGDNDQICLLGLDERDNVVQAVLDK